MIRMACVFARTVRFWLVATAVWCLFPCHASQADDFYRGKALHLIIGYGPGGGYDLYGRLLARHLSRHIPGNPTIISQNMPGAASLTALRHLESVAPKDGTFATLFDFVQIVNSLIDPKKMNIDLRKLNWIGSIAEDLSVCYAWHTRGIRTLDELKQLPEVHMGLTAAGDSQDIRLKILKKLLGVNVRAVAGYAGTGAQYIAVERGELEAGCGGWSSFPLNWRAEKLINVLVRFVPSFAPTMPKDVPYAGDLITNDRDSQVLHLLSDPAQLGKPIVMSNAVPVDRVQIVRDGVAAALKDPELLAEAERMQLEISPRTADESLKVLESINAMSPDVVELARKLIAE
jgi:tripartite-type tricarboxylate transporter receptor subunit TctC